MSSQVSTYFERLADAVNQEDGLGVAGLVRLEGHEGDAAELERDAGASGSLRAFVEACERRANAVGLDEGFGNMGAAHLAALVAALRGARLEQGEARATALAEAFQFQSAALKAFTRLYKAKGSWLMPAMRVVVPETKQLAAMADECGTGVDNLRTAKQLFDTCLREISMGQAKTQDDTRKRKITLFLINQQFKVIFRLGSMQLCRNLISTVEHKKFPPLDTFFMSEQVTYNFYLGRLMIFEDSLGKARAALEFALRNCHPSHTSNKRRILEYLVPINLFVGREPGPGLLEKYQLTHLASLVQHVRRGDVRALDGFLDDNRERFIKQGLFLCLDNLKLIAYRNLFHTVVRLYREGVEEPKLKQRVPLKIFVRPMQRLGERDPLQLFAEEGAAQEEQSEEELMDQVKCILSNLVQKRYLKAYVSHEKEILVTSPSNTFPPLRDLSS